MTRWTMNEYGTLSDGRFSIHRDSQEALRDNNMLGRPWSLWDGDEYVGNYFTRSAALTAVRKAVRS